MCGIAGFLRYPGFSHADADETVSRMTRTMVHRGPDRSDTWVDADAGVALGHRRLSILDLTSAGNQPMVSSSGRYVIAMNGEIYNHLELRDWLDSGSAPPKWRGHSDTESIVEAFDQWGVDRVLEKSVGMFAIALWDRKERQLTLIRDRIGEKPLYFGWQGRTFLFGSQLVALRAHPEFQATIDRDALATYLKHGYVAAPQSIYAGIRKLLPGTYTTLTPDRDPGAEPDFHCYWSVKEIVRHGHENPACTTPDEAVESLDSCLRRSVQQQSVADVPLGCFLSGGIDSSVVASMLQDQSAVPVKTFTIGFREEQFDEAKFARDIAAHLGTDHTELYVTPEVAMDVIPKLPQMYDEPFGDSSAIPTFLVSELAREKVTVSLSGDGGDELFGGYSRYQRSNQTLAKTLRMPKALAEIVAFGCRLVSRRTPPGRLAWKADRIAHYMRAGSPATFYDVNMSKLTETSEVLPGARAATLEDLGRFDGSSFIENMMATDTVSYLPDDILVKVDRASMFVSLESRVPLLDHRVIELAWSLPQELKVMDGVGKWILRRVLERYVPSRLFERPKKGFSRPVGEWTLGPMREWADGLLNEQRVRREGLLDPAAVSRIRKTHARGENGAAEAVWILLMFQQWYESLS
ncbi:MAG: asparagine synthase (glutamine-hydrolyzing) [Woeseiaceae bacterium]